MKCLFMIVAFAFFNKVYAQTGISIPQMTSCDNLVTAFLNKYGIPGGSFAMSKDGRIVYMRSFGFADKAKTIPTQPHNLYRIASLSKPITSIAIIKMMQDGLLTMSSRVFGPGGILQDHPVIKTANITDNRIYNITVQQLLEHSAGWNSAVNCNPSPTAPYPWYIGGCDPITFPLRVTQQLGTPNPVTEDAICKYMLQLGLNFNPGTQYRYSNVGYLYLGEIIEQLSGMSYEAYVQSAILAPLGIYDMHIGKNLLSEKLEREVEYTSTEGNTMSVYGTGVQLPWEYGGMNLNAMDAHGGWIATARDLVTLITAVDNFATKPDLLTPASIATMVAPSATSANYAKGWQVNASNNWWHSGGVPGTSTIMARTSGGYTWAVLLNRRNAVGNFWTEFDNLPWSCLAATSSWPTHDLMLAPKVNASGIVFSDVTATSIKATWVNGNGANRILIVRPSVQAASFPLDGADYMANADFAQAPTLGTGNKIVYNGTGNTATITGLTSGTNYSFRLVEYNKALATGNNALYLLGNSPTAMQNTAAALPVVLGSFGAVKQASFVQLSWQTLSEVNAAHFLIQRSTNGNLFEDIGKVAAKGSSTGALNYRFDDVFFEQAQSAKLFYRLQMTDKDGSTTFSQIAEIGIGKEKKFVISPNPARNKSTIYGYNISSIKILTLAGSVVRQQAVQVPNPTIDLTGIKSGVYILHIIGKNNTVQTEKLVVE